MRIYKKGDGDGNIKSFFFFLQFWILTFSLFHSSKTEPGRRQDSGGGNMKNGFMQMYHNP
jgi:hypothetical protein